MSRKKKVLIVDDDPGLLTQLRWALRDDFELLLAGSPREVELLLRGDTPPDAAVVDLHLPPDTATIDGGLSVIRTLRGAGSRTRIIAITANRASDFDRLAVEAGASTLLGKPVARDRLLALLNEHPGGRSIKSRGR